MAISLLTLLVVVGIVLGAFLWRLSVGPVSISFLNDRIRTEINKSLDGLEVHLSDAVIERDRKTGMPHVRLRNVEVVDSSGAVIARAPRAAIGLDASALLSASIVPRRLELIGPRILLKRSANGGFQLGFGETAAHAAGLPEAEPPETISGKSDQMQGPEDIVPETSASAIIDLLAQELSGAGKQSSALANIESVQVTDADIQLYDEVNLVNWHAPKANLSFQRMPFGFALLSELTIASGDGDPWRAEISTSYQSKSKIYTVNARIFDLVPANIADQIFALSKFAQVQLPLSGHAEVELQSDGTIINASAELSAAAGRVGLPGYISEPILIDEGSVRLDFDPTTGGIVINNSSVLIGGSRADLTGRIDPERSGDGKLQALKLALKARNVSIDPDGTLKQVIPIDRIDFEGVASVGEARLDVNDLLVVAGPAGVRLRGTFTGGERSVGMRLAGRAQDVPSDVLKRLWPPMITPKTRKWVTENVVAGRVSEADFTVDLAPDELAQAVAQGRMRNEAINLKFSLSDVTTRYFKDLPEIRAATGAGLAQGDRFDLKLDGASISWGDNQKLDLASASMVATDLLAPVTTTQYLVRATAPASTVLGYMDFPALNLLQKTKLEKDRLNGNATVDLDLTVKIPKGGSKEQVIVAATAQLTDASFKNALNDLNLEKGTITLEVAGDTLTAGGTARLAGIPVELQVTRQLAGEGDASAVLEANLTDEQRAKFAGAINDFIQGPVSVRVVLPDISGKVTKLSINADLSKAALKLDAIGWARGPKAKTTASFVYEKNDKGGAIRDFELKSSDISVSGELDLNRKGAVSEARFPVVVLSDENRFGVTLNQNDDGLAISLSGRSFDARPLLRSIFGGKGGDDDDKPKQSYSIKIDLNRVYAQRGEILTDVTGQISATKGVIQQANVQGTFISGNPVVFKITPDGDTRELRVAGRDAGAALRAANLYSKIAGGALDFEAKMNNGPGGTLRSGRLIIRDFEVRDEAALAELDRKGKPKKSSGPRKAGVAFSKLTLPFTADNRFIRIGDAVVKGPQMCATADGLIRRADGAMDIDGTIIPACALNRVPGDIPIIGDILVGDGLFGLTYALGGAISNPKFQVNPVSAIAPGIFRRFFEYGSPNDVGNSAARPKAN
ncbi:MAG: DUF3971 domain-containing protein [Hyphomicrobiales bacterium]